MHPCSLQAINFTTGSDEELIPGAPQESHNPLESNLKRNNKIMKPNQMLNLGKYISDGTQKWFPRQNPFWSPAWTQWIFQLITQMHFQALNHAYWTIRGSELWVCNYHCVFQLFCWSFYSYPSVFIVRYKTEQFLFSLNHFVGPPKVYCSKTWRRQGDPRKILKKLFSFMR